VNLNLVQLAGHLTRDVEVRYTPGGLAIAKVGIAANRRTKKNDEWVDVAMFIDVKCFGKAAESLAKHCKKGSPIYVRGALELEQWDDKATGQKRSKHVVIADEWQFTEKRQSEPAPGAATGGDAASADDTPL
jgi:single-strand DNA-binding protein